MVKVIRDFWILTKDGIVLFNRVFDETVEDQLFGALMCALDTFSKEISAHGGLSNFEISNKRFTLLRNDKLLFVASSSSKAKAKKINQELNNISEKFAAKYDEVLKDWDNDVSVFEEFREEIEDAFEDPVKKFWNGF